MSAYVASQGIPSKITTLASKASGAPPIIMSLSQTHFPTGDSVVPLVPINLTELGTGTPRIIKQNYPDRSMVFVNSVTASQMATTVSATASQVASAVNVATTVSFSTSSRNTSLKASTTESKCVLDLSRRPIIKVTQSKKHTPDIHINEVKTVKKSTSIGDVGNQIYVEKPQLMESRSEGGAITCVTKPDSRQESISKSLDSTSTDNVCGYLCKPKKKSIRDKVKATSSETLPVIPKFSNLLTSSAGRSSSAFPYQQKIVLANGASQNFIIDHTGDSNERDMLATWHPPCSSYEWNRQAADTAKQQHNLLMQSVPAGSRPPPQENIPSQMTNTDLLREVPSALDMCTRTPQLSPSYSTSDVSSVIDIEKTSSTELMSSQGEEQLDYDSSSSPKQSSPVLDMMSSEEEHQLLLSQMDGTSDHGNLSQPGSYAMESPDIGSLSARESLSSPVVWDDQKNRPETVYNEFAVPSLKQSVSVSELTSAEDAAFNNYAQEHTASSTDTVEKFDYLSRLIDTPSPPNYTNPWGLCNEGKRPKTKQQGQNNHRRKTQD